MYGLNKLKFKILSLAEVKEGEVLNIQSTPSLYINNKTKDPGTQIQIFKMLIEHLLKK